jgi:hypothetical protein
MRLGPYSGKLSPGIVLLNVVRHFGLCVRAFGFGCPRAAAPAEADNRVGIALG